MKPVALYNGKEFPEFIFIRKDLTYLFIEFIFIFQEEFLIRFKKFLDKYQISKIIIENLQPVGCEFYDEVVVQEFPTSFINSVSQDRIKTSLGATISFQMITEQGVIYTKENETLFTIVLDRDCWIAIIGLSRPEDFHFFEDISITNVIQYLTEEFQDEYRAANFSNAVVSNWP
ncbi:MAG TPA: hypothetical protein VD993_11840 [Chitinophagaceae bacterium]|nr:hypothetical protein [Chitinophagaceae bacterium]